MWITGKNFDSANPAMLFPFNRQTPHIIPMEVPTDLNILLYKFRAALQSVHRGSTARA
jgi:hypothetical protein